VANYSAGTGTIDVIPSLKNFHTRIRSELKTVNPEITVGVRADVSKVQRDIRAAVKTPTIQLKVEANTASLRKAEAEVVAAERRIAAARNTSSDSAALLDVAEKQLAETRAKSNARASQIASGELKVAQAKRAVAAATNDAGNAEAALNAARGSVRDAKVKIATDVDTLPAAGKLQAFALRAGRAYRIKLGVDPELTGAAAALATFKATAGRLSAIHVGVNLDTGAALAKLTALSMAGASIGFGVAAGVGIAGGALVALPAAIAAVLVPVGALAVGLNGVGGALSAFSQADTQAAANATSNAKAQTAAAQQITSARAQVTQAETALSRAYDAAAVAQEQSARRVQDAERQVIVAELAHLRAEQDLTRAMQEARRAQQDLAFQVIGGALAERQAVLDLADAQRALQDAQASGVGGDALARTQLAYEQQVLSLDEIRSRNGQLAQDKAASDAAGVAGSDQVVAAQDRVASAGQGVADAQQGVRDAQVESARVQIQSQQSIADAQLAVAQAQTQLAQAMADAGTVGASAADKIHAAMAKLSPSAQEFVRSFHALNPEMTQFKTSVQEALFAGLGPAFETFARSTLPAMGANLAVVSGAMNGVTKDMLAFLATTQVASQFAVLFAGIGQVVTAVGPVVQILASLLLNLAVAAMPGIVALVQAIGTVGAVLSAALAPLIASGAITQAITLIAGVVSALAPVLGTVVVFAVQLLNALGPSLIAVVQALAPVITVLAGVLLQIAPVVGQIALMIAQALLPVFQALAPVISALLPVIASLIGSALQVLVPLIQAAANIFMAFMPAIQGVVAVVASLVPVFVPLITQLAAGLMPLVQALIPVIIQLAGVIGGVWMTYLQTLIPIVIQIVQALVPLIPVIADIATQLLTALVPILPIVGGLLTNLITALLPLLPPLLQLAMALLPAVIAVITLLMPIIQFLGDLLIGALVWVIQNLVLPALERIVGTVKVVAAIFTWLLGAIMNPVKQIGDGIQWLWDNAIHPAFQWIVDKAGEVGDAFDKMGDKIGGIWDRLKKLVHDGIQVIIDFVWNDGLRKVVNLLPGVNLPEVKLAAFAGGGVLPGYAPGRDSILSLLSPGEAVLVPELVRAIGPATILAANAAAMAGRGYARGGVLGVAQFAAGGIATTPATVPTAAPATAVTIDPAAIAALGAIAALATVAVTALAVSLVTLLGPALLQITTAITLLVLPAVAAVALQTTALALLTGVQWAIITQIVAVSVAAQTFAMTELQNAMAATRAAIAFTADWAVSQWDRIRGAAADPIRWVLAFPINAGIVAAWNTLDDQFALGNHVAPIPIAFALGGRVTGPGTATSDSILARVSAGEFVVREAIARRALPFLTALNNGVPEALQATGARRFASGGLVADTGSSLDAALARGIVFAKQQDGKPYVWGAVGPDGYDCSGFMSAITNVLRGESNPYRRLGVARSQPWPGFVPGLSTAFATGFSDVHTAGTLAGINVESGGSPSRVRFGPGAAGADSIQFGGHASLPIVGGTFVPGGGAGIDFGALIGPYFADTYRLIGQISTLCAGSLLAAQASGIATTATDGVRAAAVSALTALTTTSAGAAGSPEVVGAVRAVAARFGWGGGPQWDALSWIISHESGWNPAAANPSSSARGLFQKMVSVNGPIESTAAGQAEWGLGYISSRYGDPLGAQRWWQAHNWYDQGGIASGSGWMYKGTNEPERVLSPAQTRAFDSLVATVSRNSSATLTGQSTTGSGQFRGALYLDSGEFLGLVDGRIADAHDDTADAISRGTR